MARIPIGWLAGPLAVLGAGYLRGVRATTRLERLNPCLPTDGGSVIYAFWHEQLAMMPWVQFRPPTVVPISRSEDGEVTTRIFGHLGVQGVRGSSSRGGAAAARGMIQAARRGLDMGITPDGPRGPVHVVQPGATWIAKATGRPLLPVAYACTRYRRLSTWDRMLLPLPFGRGVFAYGELMWVSRGADEAELARADDELAVRMNAVTERSREQL
jgi:lysophospholipid acyltransferase (LPLAT)-like uncharacterized protein